MGQEITVTFKTELPVAAADATKFQIREWLEYNLGWRGGCSMQNPLVSYGLEGFDVQIDTD